MLWFILSVVCWISLPGPTHSLPSIIRIPNHPLGEVIRPNDLPSILCLCRQLKNNMEFCRSNATQTKCMQESHDESLEVSSPPSASRPNKRLPRESRNLNPSGPACAQPQTSNPFFFFFFFYLYLSPASMWTSDANQLYALSHGQVGGAIILIVHPQERGCSRCFQPSIK